MVFRSFSVINLQLHVKPLVLRGWASGHRRGKAYIAEAFNLGKFGKELNRRFAISSENDLALSDRKIIQPGIFRGCLREEA